MTRCFRCVSELWLNYNYRNIKCPLQKARFSFLQPLLTKLLGFLHSALNFELNCNVYKVGIERIKGNFLENDFWTPTPPPPPCIK